MINFRISNLDNSLLTIVKPAGKSIPLILGEIVEAEIIDILPAGSITLKIKGSFITAKTEIPMHKDSTAFFKVLSTDKSGRELRLQFMGYLDKSVNEQFTDYKGDVLSKLLQDLSAAILKEGRITKNFSAIIEQLLKVLPSDIYSLPKEMRIQLQNLLQTSLKQTGESIQTRLDNLFKSLPGNYFEKNFINQIVENFKKDLMVNIERLSNISLKNALDNTGVALEAKLKSLVELLQQMDQSSSQPDVLPVKKDLKAGLLQLRHYLLEEGKESLIKIVDGLLKDIETFQLLSKTTDSFYTFLPVNWTELKDGEIAFRKGRGDAGSSYSCKIDLDLKSPGKLTIMVFMLNKEFFVSFRVEKDGFRAVLNSHMDELKERFSEKGLNLKASIFLDSDSLLEDLEKFESAVGIINIKA
jgi:flagellar hook-length control protein FliK